MTSITQDWKAGKPAPGWRTILKTEFQQPYMQELIQFLDQDRVQHTIFPEPKNIFRAYSLTDYSDVRVVILGQDPYHGPGQANGMAFSVWDDVKTPPSLKNMYKEIASDIGTPPPATGNLDCWSRQGVFLLNTVLTVRQAQANSHKGKGWERFTARTIQALSERQEPMVFMLWGRNARDHRSEIDESRHLILEAPHPSPLSAYAGFFGCRHFSKANQFLQQHGQPVIQW
jgi:uracil-DNA glycosylase